MSRIIDEQIDQHPGTTLTRAETPTSSQELAQALAAGDALKDLVLFTSEIIHCGIYSHFTSNGFTDVLPPELSKLRVVRHVGAGRSPGNTCRAAVELNQAAKLGCALGEGGVANVTVADRSQADMGLLQ